MKARTEHQAKRTEQAVVSVNAQVAALQAKVWIDTYANGLGVSASTQVEQVPFSVIRARSTTDVFTLSAKRIQCTKAAVYRVYADVGFIDNTGSRLIGGAWLEKNSVTVSGTFGYVYLRASLSANRGSTHLQAWLTCAVDDYIGVSYANKGDNTAIALWSNAQACRLAMEEV